MEIVLFFVAMLATTLGAMSGMGGGIIIKPVMDAVSGYAPEEITFMSSCTVLAMAIVSVYRGRKDTLDINYPITIALAVGACGGGILGKWLFTYISINIVQIQCVILGIVYVVIYFYIKWKENMNTRQVESLGTSVVIGGGLGSIAAFLGIGGGLINVAILSYFYSSPVKVTIKRSIFIILLSQIASFFTTCATGIPSVNHLALGLMILGGCLGAVLGGKQSKKFTEHQTESFLKDVLVAVMLLNMYNLGRYS